jgi:dimethylargininase
MKKNITRAIVRRPGRSLVRGLTTANLGKPDFQKALLQHDQYIEALKSCGVEVLVLKAEEDYPDSVFVEDTAVLTERCAVLTNPAVHSRQGEEKSIYQVLTKFYPHVEDITAPGNLEGGDVMRVQDRFYVGLSSRTNEIGAAQLKSLFKQYGYTVDTVKMKNFLHLKSGLAYLEKNCLLAAGEFITDPKFENFNRIIVDDSESYAANCLWVNDTVLVPLGFPKTRAAIRRAGYKVLEVAVSEFRKLDGGLSCLSLRFSH